jgi:CubicO group peptidase (beta-lactamase class C family)
VQRISGQSFDDYVDQHVFAPLDMKHSSFRQPLPAALQPLVSKGYMAGTDKPQGYEIVNPAPAGNLAASGEDMGRFMIAHLQNGAYGSNRILKEATAKQMHGTALTVLPPLHRMLLGFYETSINGHRAISHAGDTQWFHSDLGLFVDDGLGLYISMNSSGSQEAAHKVRAALFKGFAIATCPVRSTRARSTPPPRSCMRKTWPASTRTAAAPTTASSRSPTSRARPRSCRPRKARSRCPR